MVPNLLRVQLSHQGPELSWTLTQVAVKVVTSHSDEQQMRFIREIKTLKACLDPNIVQFLGACIDQQRTLMVMQVRLAGVLVTAPLQDCMPRQS